MASAEAKAAKALAKAEKARDKANAANTTLGPVAQARAEGRSVAPGSTAASTAKKAPAKK